MGNIISPAIKTILLNVVLLIFLTGLIEKNFKELSINLDKKGIKKFLLGGVTAVLYVISIQLLRVAQGLTVININYAAIKKTLITIVVWGVAHLFVSLFEEILFRKYLLDKISKSTNICFAVIIQAVIFGIIHYFQYQSHDFLWGSIVNAMLMGLFVGIIYIYSGSLMFPIGYHLFGNLTSLLIDGKDYSALYFTEVNLTYSSQNFFVNYTFYGMIGSILMITFFIIGYRKRSVIKGMVKGDTI